MRDDRPPARLAARIAPRSAAPRTRARQRAGYQFIKNSHLCGGRLMERVARLDPRARAEKSSPKKTARTHHPAVVENFWVSWVLRRLFADGRWHSG